ncbi:hypothetical protein [Mesorhizobium sp. ES1-6]|uniref:hypothetical protein n=1 Tax=Mesorhizobium sp. ES1-6 TaxID=2876626 RepID=UPI001CC9B52D|nr:hypothetical protein [Mesorhizobium sp. ES1-6]
MRQSDLRPANFHGTAATSEASIKAAGRSGRMHGRSWILQQRLADARLLREEIARLQQELLVVRTASKRRRLIEVGCRLQNYKARLERLERCISALQSPNQRQQQQHWTGQS